MDSSVAFIHALTVLSVHGLCVAHVYYLLAWAAALSRVVLGVLTRRLHKFVTFGAHPTGYDESQTLTSCLVCEHLKEGSSMNARGQPRAC
jgi:hypothetical protein